MLVKRLGQFQTGRPYVYTNKKATVQKRTVAKKTQKVEDL